ncbi:hypothetical protein FHW16_000017 [Phyllobacterium myrsinacearum]|uniref:Uncharacterized protein n=1 Tax=Phyllobacterium myrsinacearum TaxID=28101 RepID=A0A839EDE0_9HYPH|nr:hypothetical protein [Phyllobacterium myrsinacearum]
MSRHSNSFPIRMWLAVSTFLVVTTPSIAWSSPMLRWDSNDKGFWIVAANPDDRPYNCSTTYKLSYGGQSDTRTESFFVPPKSNGVAFVKTVNLPPNTPWTAVQIDQPSCY